MQEDLNMTDVEWSAGISLFYVGYIISQIPANVIIAKGKPRWLLPACMLGWSAVTISMPAMKSSWSFMLCRFLVGVTEGPSRRVSHDQFVVHERRVSAQDGYLACR
jgi:MFS family permease